MGTGIAVWSIGLRAAFGAWQGSFAAGLWMGIGAAPVLALMAAAEDWLARKR